MTKWPWACSPREESCELDSQPYHYIVIRRDLTPGQALAQATHAAGESGPATAGTHAVVLAAEDETHLLALSQALRSAQIQHHQIFEPDPPWSGQMLALGIRPGPRTRALRRIVGSMPLWR